MRLKSLYMYTEGHTLPNSYFDPYKASNIYEQNS